MEYRGVYIEWVDAASRAEWMSKEELQEYAEAECIIKQLGWLVTETESHLTLSGAHHPEDKWNYPTFGDTIRIPKTCVRVMKYITW